MDKLTQLVVGMGHGDRCTQLPQEKKRSTGNPIPSQKQVQSLGIDISSVLNDPKIRKILVDHANESSKAIESVPEQYRVKLGQAALDAFYGTLHEGQCLLDRIQEIYPMPKADAMMIARDQTSKLTGRLDQARQEAIGVTEYVWHTTIKTCNHSERNGKKFKWKTPPPGGHPGQSHLCGCFAQAVIDIKKIIRAAKK